LKHFIRFGHAIWQRGIRLERHGLGVESLAQMMQRVVRQTQFARQTGGGFTFTDAAQQENHLDRAQLLAGKHGTAIDRIHILTVATAIARHMVAFGSPKEPRVIHTAATLRTRQPIRMKVLRQPTLT